MGRIEYKVIFVSDIFINVEKRLNKLAGEGWRLIAVSGNKIYLQRN